jgi:hypothetical protein
VVVKRLESIRLLLLKEVQVFSCLMRLMALTPFDGTKMLRKTGLSAHQQEFR